MTAAAYPFRPTSTRCSSFPVIASAPAGRPRSVRPCVSSTEDVSRKEGKNRTTSFKARTPVSGCPVTIGDEPPDPVDGGLLGPRRVVQPDDRLVHPVQQLSSQGPEPGHPPGRRVVPPSCPGPPPSPSRPRQPPRCIQQGHRQKSPNVARLLTRLPKLARTRTIKPSGRLSSETQQNSRPSGRPKRGRKQELTQPNNMFGHKR